MASVALRATDAQGPSTVVTPPAAFLSLAQRAGAHLQASHQLAYSLDDRLDLTPHQPKLAWLSARKYVYGNLQNLAVWLMGGNVCAVGGAACPTSQYAVAHAVQHAEAAFSMQLQK